MPGGRGVVAAVHHLPGLQGHAAGVRDMALMRYWLLCAIMAHSQLRQLAQQWHCIQHTMCTQSLFFDAADPAYSTYCILLLPELLLSSSQSWLVTYSAALPGARTVCIM